MRRILLVVNRNAGRVTPAAVRAVRTTLSACARVDVVATRDPREVDRHVRDLGPRELVVTGGDGTIHHTVGTLRRLRRLAEVPIGIVPMGSGNDLLLGLGRETDPVAVARRWQRTCTRSMDLVVTGGTGVVNAAGAGIGVRASAWSRPFKGAIPGAVAYRLGALAAAAATTGWDLEVTVDGERVAPQSGRRVLSVVVANGSTFGHGAPAVPPATPDDGLLDVVVARASGPLARVGYGLALRHGDHLRRGDVAVASGRRVEIRGEPVAYNLDGELDRRPRRTRSFTVQPAAWRLRLPA